MSAAASNKAAPAIPVATPTLSDSDFFLPPESADPQPGLASARHLLHALSRFCRHALREIANAAERFVPPACRQDVELTRRARLIARFGFLGAVSGAFFALFYVLIGHDLGAAIVIACSSGFAAVPWLLRRSGSLLLAGNALCLILVLGFTTLCFVEGGLEGHAFAWLVSVPLCALLLVGVRPATGWALAALSAGGAVVATHLAGFHIRPAYDPSWQPYVSAAGYLSLIAFMFLLGVIFEAGRERAFAGLRDALARLEMSNAQLAHLSQEKSDFLGIAAHDLKNPLTVVIGSADLLKMNLPPEQVAMLSENIAHAGQRMLRLIKDLLDASAIEQGRFTSNLERCDLRALAAESVANNQSHAARKGITLTTENGPPAWGRADRYATLQILDNLISNALKFSPAQSSVLVRAVTENGFVFVAVKDHGPGVSPADHARLFGKFVRLSARPTGGESSTGLGLSIVKKLAEAMAGTVYCQSVLGEGATFILRLPAADADGATPTTRLPASKSPSLPLALDSQTASLQMAQPAAPAPPATQPQPH